MSETQPFLSIIIPCYNEAENLRAGVLEEVWEYLRAAPFTWELIISDDGSADDSRELVRNFLKGKSGVRPLENDHGGKPAAILHGLEATQGEFLLFTDMDQSTPLAEVEKLLPFTEEYDVIIGSRADRKNFPLYRRIGSRLFKFVRQTLLLRQINDTQCGFKLIRTELAHRLFPRLEFFRKKQEARGWTVTSFDVELLHLAELDGKRIKEAIVAWEDRDRATGKKKSYLKESREMLGQILRVKWNDWRGRYKRA